MYGNIKQWWNKKITYTQNSITETNYSLVNEVSFSFTSKCRYK